MSVIRVLALNSDQDGVGYFRCLMPHLCLDDPEIKIELRLLSDMSLPLLDERYLKQFQIIFYNKIIPFADPDKEALFYDMCHRNNIKIIYDIDDWYILDNTHLNFKNWRDNGSQQKIEDTIRKADVVVTTTPIFVQDLRLLNPEVYVLENAINMNEHQWITRREPSDKVRFIWGGGISHQVDLRLLQPGFRKFDKKFLDRSEFYLCGYDLRIKHADGRMGKDDPQRSQWTLFENLITNDGKYITDIPHREFLKTYDNTNFGINPIKEAGQWYHRRWTKAILEFGTMYNEADVALAPLKDKHAFNLHKSQLKLIEAGVHGMPVLMSKSGPYLIDDIEKNGLGLYVEEKASDWDEKMKWMVANPQAVQEMGARNREYFLTHFEMQVVNKKRAQLYKDVAAGIKSHI